MPNAARKIISGQDPMPSTKVEYRMIDVDGEPMPAPVQELARIDARKDRAAERAKTREIRRAEKEAARAKARMVEIDLGDGRTMTVTRERFRQIERARRDYAERERQKMLDLSIQSEHDGPPWERKFSAEKSTMRVKKGFYTFDY